MGIQKNATYKVHNGTDFDEINFKTMASQVKTSGGSDVETQLADKVNKSDFQNGEGINNSFWEKRGNILQQWVSGSIIPGNDNISINIILVFPLRFLHVNNYIVSVYGYYKDGAWDTFPIGYNITSISETAVEIRVNPNVVNSRNKQVDIRVQVTGRV